MPRPLPTRRRGFSLIELVASLGAMSVVLVALGSTIVLAGRIAPQPDDPPQIAADSARALDQLLAEISQSARILELSASAIEFRVPDRTGDATPETIRYTWAGKTQPLIRTINAGTPVTVLESVDTLELWTLTQTEPGSTGTASNTHASYTDTPSVVNNIGGPRMVAQVFTADLPDDATTWSISAVEVLLKAPDALPATDELKFEIREVDGSSRPTGSTLAATTISAKSVGASHAFVRVSDLRVEGLRPDQQIAIVLSAPASSAGFESGLVTLPEAVPGMHLASSGDGGTIWNIGDRLYTPYKVFGTVTAASVATSRVHSVGVLLHVDGSRPMRAATRLLAAPEVRP